MNIGQAIDGISYKRGSGLKRRSFCFEDLRQPVQLYTRFLLLMNNDRDAAAFVGSNTYSLPGKQPLLRKNTLSAITMQTAPSLLQLLPSLLTSDIPYPTSIARNLPFDRGDQR